MLRAFLTSLIVLAFAAQNFAEELDWIRVSDGGKGFVLSESATPFVPWGFNYDHEGDGKLLEDYWNDQWPTVESAFQEMKQLGANVVRIHLQFGKFMESPNKPRQQSLAQLTRLLRLAEETGLYIDLTGLGCYHKQDVPEWYDKLSEADRWAAQAVFWEAVAKTCSKSPAIFCYDLMNEPVVPGGNKKRDDWLGPGFGDKHFVQFITLDRKGRNRPDVARKWIRTLVTAIREHDKRHLITVGLVPWSLNRPGLTSGFVPEKIADDLDFIAMHIYPEKSKVDEAIETVKGFAAVGKPVIIEETFVLKCGADELEEFIDKSRTHATGWIGFYWGKTPDELRPPKTIPEALTLSWLELFQKKTSEILGQSFLSNGVTAHRGNSSEFPENTIPAFQSGIDVGADWIELDILRTKDGQLVVIHDRTTKRVGDGDLVVAESTLDELAAVDVAADFRRRMKKTVTECPPQRIPLLKDVLLLVMKQNQTRVSIQPKMDCVADAVALVKELKAEQWVGFNDGNLNYMAEVKRLAPDIPVFWDRGANTDIDDDIATAKKHGFESLVLHHSGVTPEKVRKIKAAGIVVGAWTVNDRNTMKRLIDAGVDRLYTDHPRVLLTLKAKRRQNETTEGKR
jgi:glycerophosphoryl diester phosphodiesterase